MAQIQSPETYADGQQVTAARLNNQTNGAILLPGAVTDQTALTANTVASGDTVLLHDASASALRKATAGDLLGSGLPVTTSGITGASGVDLAITPAAGQKVDVGGAFEANSLNVTGNSTIGGNETVSGNLLVTGSSTLTGGVTGGFTVGGLITSASTPTASDHLTNKAYVDGTSSILSNGWTRLPNGLIIQWGTHLTAMANYSVQTITFPTPFPNACFTVQITARAVTAATNGTATLENGIKLNGVPTTTNFSVYVNWSGSVAGAQVYPTWIAIGN